MSKKHPHFRKIRNKYDLSSSLWPVTKQAQFQLRFSLPNSEKPKAEKRGQEKQKNRKNRAGKSFDRGVSGVG
jgi:hypothetical protein